MRAASTVWLLGLAMPLAWASDRLAQPHLPGIFVPFDQLNRCPPIQPRISRPANASDVRPDDIKVLMALGDSITAGLLAESAPDSAVEEPNRSGQKPLKGPIFRLPSEPLEYRGRSYAIGGDPGSITIPNILRYWTADLVGMSTGSYLPIGCTGPLCIRPKSYGLNAAMGGSVASMLAGQVSDHILPRLEKYDVPATDWKFANIGIGANDICAFCLAPNISLPLLRSPAEFAGDIADAVELLRQNIPNLIVNIIGSIRVSAIYKMTSLDPYCRALHGPFPPIIPRLSLECACAMLPGPAGDLTRQKMDELGEAYDHAVLAQVIKWNEEQDPSFGVMWQPGSVINPEDWPITALSHTDCFHPSQIGHEHVAAGFWNRLTLGDGKSVPLVWEDEVRVRCLEESDRFHITS